MRATARKSVFLALSPPCSEVQRKYTRSSFFIVWKTRITFHIQACLLTGLWQGAGGGGMWEVGKKVQGWKKKGNKGTLFYFVNGLGLNQPAVVVFTMSFSAFPRMKRARESLRTCRQFLKNKPCHLITVWTVTFQPKELFFLPHNSDNLGLRFMDKIQSLQETSKTAFISSSLGSEILAQTNRTKFRFW